MSEKLPAKLQDRVFIHNLTLFGNHGIYPAERELGHRLSVDIECLADLRAAGTHDDYAQTICYAALSEIAQKVVGGPPVHLIETIAERIASDILAKWPQVQEVLVRIRKPWAPLGLVVDHVGIEIRRQQ